MDATIYSLFWVQFTRLFLLCGVSFSKYPFWTKLTVKNHLIEFGCARAWNFVLFARFSFETKYNRQTSTAINVHTGSCLIGIWCFFSLVVFLKKRSRDFELIFSAVRLHAKACPQHLRRNVCGSASKCLIL